MGGGDSFGRSDWGHDRWGDTHEGSSPSLSSSSSFNRHDYRQLPNSSLMGYLKPTVALIVVDCAMLLWLLTISHKIIENENVAFFIFFSSAVTKPTYQKST